MNIFQRAYRAIVSFLTIPSVEVIEKEVAAAVVPVAETALNAAVAANPAAEAVIVVLEPIVNKELK